MFIRPDGLAVRDGSGVFLTGNGRGIGPVGDQFNYTYNGQTYWDEGARKPYLDKNDRLAVTINTGRFTYEKGEKVPIREHRLVRDLVNNGVISDPMVTNATALRKEEWIELDRTALRAARYEMTLYADINRLSGSFGGFNAMGKLMLEYETMADPGEAIVDFDGLTPGRGDQTKFQLEGFPLALTHADFQIPMRLLTISRNSGTPLDANLSEASARRVGEMVEKTAVGNVTGVTYGGNSTQVGGYGRTSQVYGATNFPARLTKTGYKPTLNGRSGTGWVPNDTILDVLAAIDQLRLNKFRGPWMIYHSNDWDQYLDRDYFITSTATNTPISTRTLRERLCAIQNGDGTDAGKKVILGCKRLDMLFGTAPGAGTGNAGAAYYDTLYPYTFLLVQMTPDVVRAINGMDITTVQWQEKGGMQLKFKVMAIQGAMYRADFYQNCGVLHLTFSS